MAGCSPDKEMPMGWRGWLFFAGTAGLMWSLGLSAMRGESGPLAWLTMWHFSIGTIALMLGSRLLWGKPAGARRPGVREVLLDDENWRPREISPKGKKIAAALLFLMAGLLFAMPAGVRGRLG